MAELPALPPPSSLEIQDVAYQSAQLQEAICQLPKEFASRDTLSWYCLPKPVLQGAQSLVHILAELRAPESGWPAQVPHTVDTVSPYISEETYEFLETLHQLALRTEGNLSVTTADHLQLVDWKFRQLELNRLIPQLLWEIASSSYEVMRLLQGIRTQCTQTETELGITRLVVIAESPATETSLDLFTRNAPQSANFLADDSQVQVEDGDFCQISTAVGALLAQLTQHLLQTNPIIKAFLEGIPINLLLPGRRWQKTTIKLSLALSFVAEKPQDNRGWRLGSGEDEGMDLLLDLDDFVMPEIPTFDELDLLMADLPDLTAESLIEDLTLADTNDTALNPHEKNGHRPPEIPQAQDEPPASQQENLLQSWLTVTDERWSQSFAEMIARQHLINHLPLTKLLRKLATPNVPLDRLQRPLIHYACNAVQVVHGDVALFKQNFFQHPIFLKDLIPRLLWYVNRSAATIMELIHGVHARCLAPGEPWQQGQLRLLALLQITTDRFETNLDLSNSTECLTPLPTLHRSAMLLTPEYALCQQPHSVAQVENTLYRTLRQTTPEIDWLLRGTAIDLHLLSSEPDSDTDPIPGSMQLALSLQFKSTQGSSRWER